MNHQPTSFSQFLIHGNIVVLEFVEPQAEENKTHVVFKYPIG